MLRVTSSRRPAGLKPSDYDHEISLVDHDAARTPTEPTESADSSDPNAASGSAAMTRSSTTSRLLPTEEEQTREASSQQDDEQTTHPEVDHDGRTRGQSLSGPPIQIQGASPAEPDEQQHEPRLNTARVERETAIDILYENERGGFLCGIALFSSQALGGLDPPAWTNQYHKASPTNIHTAQVPDPSWEWTWPEWRINHQEGVDDGGWEYAFAFGKKFSWHGPSWWNSFVRRRAWTRKRAQRLEDISVDPHMLNPDYFQVLPASDRKLQAHTSVISSRTASRSSFDQKSALEEEEDIGDIDNIETLLRCLRRARIDREKLEAIENYLVNSSDLEKLQDSMHDVMSIFVFQASRRIMLSRLIHIYDESEAHLKKKETPETKQRKVALKGAIKHADEEVRRLAYWSDVKKMAEGGEANGAVDCDRGWGDDEWQGVDQSGPAPPKPPKSNGKKPHK